MRQRLRVGITAIALSALPTVAGCSGDETPNSAPEHPGTVVPTRFWAGGSTIDASHPAAAAAGLKPDQAAYCAMLSATVAAGSSVLSGVAATDPALVASTEAFVAEANALAPKEIAGSWRVLGDALVSMVKGAPSGDGKQVADASTKIAAHAKSACRLDLGKPA